MELTGNSRLIIDLEVLLDAARNDHFDDFKSQLALPRLELNRRLFELIQNNREGLYDS